MHEPESGTNATNRHVHSNDLLFRALTSTAVNAMKPVAASGGSIVANFDVLDDGEDAAGRTGARLLNLAMAAWS